MVILAIGPSGVGKTDYCEYAGTTVGRCRAYDLDKMVSEYYGEAASALLPRVGNDDDFLRLCRAQVESLSEFRSRNIAAVAVGAGALQSRMAVAWLDAHPGPTIAILAPPEEVYDRGGNRNANRSVDQYINVEYSGHRLKLYERSSHTCDVTGLTVDKARRVFAAKIAQILAEQSWES